MSDDICLVVIFQSVYGLQNDVRSHSPTHTPAPQAKQPTQDELQEQVLYRRSVHSQGPPDVILCDCKSHVTRPERLIT